MSIKKVMLAVGTEDEERTERLAEEAIAVAEPAGAEVVLTHVFTDEEFDTVRSRLGVDETSEGRPLTPSPSDTRPRERSRRRSPRPACRTRSGVPSATTPRGRRGGVCDRCRPRRRRRSPPVADREGRLRERRPRGPPLVAVSGDVRAFGVVIVRSASQIRETPAHTETRAIRSGVCPLKRPA